MQVYNLWEKIYAEGKNHILLNFLPATTFQITAQRSEIKHITVVSMLQESQDYNFKAIKTVEVYGAEYQGGKSM